ANFFLEQALALVLVSGPVGALVQPFVERLAARFELGLFGLLFGQFSLLVVDLKLALGTDRVGGAAEITPKGVVIRCVVVAGVVGVIARKITRIRAEATLKGRAKPVPGGGIALGIIHEGGVARPLKIVPLHRLVGAEEARRRRILKQHR